MGSTAERLRKALSIRDMKQSELSARTGIGKSSISTYLTGAYIPKQKNIYKMAQALDVNEAWLMGLDVPMERAGPPKFADSSPDKLILTAQEETLVRDFRSLDKDGKEFILHAMAMTLPAHSGKNNTAPDMEAAN